MIRDDKKKGNGDDEKVVTEEDRKANEKLSRKSRFQLFRKHVRINFESRHQAEPSERNR